MNSYIIPTIGRKTLERTIESIRTEEPLAEILICTGDTAGINRNNGLNEATGDWIFFIDDDDYYSPNYLLEIEDNLDIVVFRMQQHDRVIPRYEKNYLVEGNVGINFAIKKSFYKSLNIKFQKLQAAEDWEFLKRCLINTTQDKVKITKNIHYNAPIANHMIADSERINISFSIKDLEDLAHKDPLIKLIKST